MMSNVADQFTQLLFLPAKLLRVPTIAHRSANKLLCRGRIGMSVGMILSYRSKRLLLVSALVTATIFLALEMLTAQTTKDVKGTWSGTFFSKHSDTAPFTMTVVITPNGEGHLVGSSSLNSDCLKGAQLNVTWDSSVLVLAGSDEEGDSITVRGTLDSSGTLLKTTYILNGSPSGRCETDDGSGSLAKR
jgi:hypothetical protein